MITKFNTKYSSDICDTLLNQWESDCKSGEDKSTAIFERKKDSYLNNATTEFRNKDRDESNPEKKGKHGKFTTKFPNKGKNDKRNRSRSRSDSTKSGKQGGECDKTKMWQNLKFFDFQYLSRDQWTIKLWK